MIGKFLKHLRFEAIATLSQYVPVREINARVISISESANIEINCEREMVTTDLLLLCIGHVNIREQKSLLSSNLVDVYSGEINSISKNASVGVIGTGLRAVDAIRILHQQKHQGKIVLSSTSGKLPRVQPSTYGEFGPLLPPLDFFARFGSRSITLPLLWKALLRDFERVGIPKVDAHNLFDASRTTEDNWSQEIVDATFGDRRWFARAFQLTAQMEEVWQHLADHDQKYFIKNLRSIWMPNLIGMPLENAEIIKMFFNERQLLVMDSYLGFQPEKSNRPGANLIFGNHDKVEIDILIDATPFGVNNNGRRNKLLDELVRHSNLKQSSLGRIFTHWPTMAAIKNNGLISKKIFCAGEFALGPNLVPPQFNFFRFCSLLS